MFQAFELLEVILKTFKGRLHLAREASVFVSLYTPRYIIHYFWLLVNQVLSLSLSVVPYYAQPWLHI
jgi:hypothetical protein